MNNLVFFNCFLRTDSYEDVEENVYSYMYQERKDTWKAVGITDQSTIVVPNLSYPQQRMVAIMNHGLLDSLGPHTNLRTKNYRIH